MIRWFSSDLHLGDPHMARRRYCGDDVAKHDAWLAARWDAKIAPEDSVWLLGDVVAGMSLEDFTYWLAARPGRKHLIIGNWDLDLEKDLNVWRATGFESVSVGKQLTLLDGDLVQLSHYPLEIPGRVLHGHTHKKAKATRPGVVHVGWDAWRRYVPEYDLINYLKERK